MLQEYTDLLTLTDKAPIWYDEAGVPRWCDFTPDMCNNIYAKEAVLMEIACQSCGERYKVAMSWHPWAGNRRDPANTSDPSLADKLLVGWLHYGDPPCFKCSAGRTMNCADLRVLEFWRRDKSTGHEWQRVPELEVTLEESE